MTAPRYIGLQDLKDYIGLGTTTGADGLLNDCILRAESAIDDYTRRNFAGTAGTVYFNRFSTGQVNGQALYLDRDLHTLVGVTNGDTQAIPSGSVWLEPRNQGPPYRVLRLKSSYTWVWNTDSDIVISGTFGFSTIAPADIQHATVRTAAYYFKQKDTGPGDVAGFPEGGEQTFAKGLPDDVRWILSPYRSKTGGIV